MLLWTYSLWFLKFLNFVAQVFLGHFKAEIGLYILQLRHIEQSKVCSERLSHLHQVLQLHKDRSQPGIAILLSSYREAQRLLLGMPVSAWRSQSQTGKLPRGKD